MEADDCHRRDQRIALELHHTENAVADDHRQRGVQHGQDLDRFARLVEADAKHGEQLQKHRHRPVMERRMIILPVAAHIKVGQLQAVFVPVFDVARVTDRGGKVAHVVLTVDNARI